MIANGDDPYLQSVVPGTNGGMLTVASLDMCNGLGLLIRVNTHTRYTDMWRSQPLPEQQRQTN